MQVIPLPFSTKLPPPTGSCTALTTGTGSERTGARTDHILQVKMDTALKTDPHLNIGLIIVVAGMVVK